MDFLLPVLLPRSLPAEDGIVTRILAELLFEALEEPTPRTLDELREALESRATSQGAIATELIARVRDHSTREPDLTLVELVERTRHQPVSSEDARRRSHGSDTRSGVQPSARANHDSESVQPHPLDQVRHDLKNVVTALRSGCMLVERFLTSGDAASALEIVEEMRAELERASGIVERVRDERERPGT